jgi:glycosyltransferase involved in cell wall biosynthesis
MRGIDPAYTLAHDQRMLSSLKSDEKMAGRRRLLFVAPEDWFFVSHFIGFARAARQAGFEVGLITRLGEQRTVLETEGIRLFAIEGDRGSLALGRAFSEMAAIRAAIRDFRPDLLHLIALRAIVLGRVASLWAGVGGTVLAPTGLGYLFSKRSPMHRLARSGLKRLIVWSLAWGRARLLVENHDDPVKLGVNLSHPGLVVVGGAGLDPDHFEPLPETPSPPLRFAVVARMLRAKGIAEAVAAFALARERHAGIELHLYGDIDAANPTSFTRAEMMQFAALPGVFWHGFERDIRKVWRNNHVAVLLTVREGMPRTLAEAAACARPIIAADVPGCREIVQHEVNGLRVPLGDVPATAAALARLASQEAERLDMGRRSRQLFESRFTTQQVTQAVLDLYADLLRPASL